MPVDIDDMIGPEWHHYPGEMDTLWQLAAELPDRPVIVNIGTGYGTSSLAFYLARDDATIFTIDIDSREKAFETWAEAGIVPGRIIPILGSSWQVGAWWPWAVDLVFVDGAHDEEGVRLDIVMWKPMVKIGGFLVFHDYDNPVTAGVKPVVDDMMRGQVPYLHEGYIIAFKKDGE